ncbi:MAG TPA: ATP-binding cassette domain-containing protein [Solirubrobacteraceae bacterium]|jgi:energy-coupling factor transporter ATP-binding protein EcfA2|nr:ATP-binding cassette domain-containing protein [Solirubrobacteraceae bacterium]
MTLLELDRVSRHHRHGALEHVVLRGISLTIEPGELVAVWGPRRCGRSTLLRIAAGIEPPDAGVVRFAGRELGARGGDALGRGVGYVRLDAHQSEGRVVLDELVLAQLARGVTATIARTRAHEALRRAEASHCTSSSTHALDSSETVRVALARTLVQDPALLVIDEPVKGVDLLERDAILALLRTFADEGITVLVSAGDATALLGADRAFALSEGVLRGEHVREGAQVLPLRRLAGV